MRRRIAVITLVVVAILAGGMVYLRRQSPGAKQAKLIEQFIAILPDSLGNDHIVEIRQLFYTLGKRAESGAVKPETLAGITKELQQHVAQGHITSGDLVHFMAEVGYATYKDDPHYNPSGDTIDHPVLNPHAGMVKLGFDSTQYDSAFWADYRKFEKKVRDEQFSDSASGPVRRHPGR